MVSTAYWNKLSEDEKTEYKALSSDFINAVKNSDANDGYEFALMYPVQSKDDVYFMAKEGNDEPFAGITSNSKKVIETLYADASQNYGR